MANLKYNLGKTKFGNLLDLSSATKLKVMLVTTAYVGTANVDDSMATAIAGDIGTGGGYTTHPSSAAELLVNPDMVVDNTNDLSKFDADDITWAASSITAGGAVIWDEDTADTPLVLIDFGGDQVSSNGNFTIAWNADGIFTIA